MADTSQGEGWWAASDGKWYPPEQHPDAAYRAQFAPPPPPPTEPKRPIDYIVKMPDRGEGSSLPPPVQTPPSAGGPEPAETPWWQSWWAITIGALLLVMIAGGVIQAFSGDDDDEPSTVVADEPEESEEPEVAEPTPVETEAADPEPTATEAPTATPRPTPTPTPSVIEADVGIVDQGFYLASEDIYTWWVEVTNEGAGVATGIQFDVTAFDADGVIIDDSFDFIDFLLPGQTTVGTGTFFDPPGAVDTIEVDGGFDDADVDPSTVLSWNIGEPTVSRGEFSTTDVVFEVSHTGEADQEFVAFVAVFRDAGGSVVHVASGFEDVPASQTVRVEISEFSDRLTQLSFDRVDVYVAP